MNAGTYQKRDLVIPNIIIIKFQNEKTTFNNNILMDLEILGGMAQTTVWIFAIFIVLVLCPY